MFDTRLRTLRQEKKITQAELAKEMNIDADDSLTKDELFAVIKANKNG